MHALEVSLRVKRNLGQHCPTPNARIKLPCNCLRLSRGPDDTLSGVRYWRSSHVQRRRVYEASGICKNEKNEGRERNHVNKKFVLES